MNEKTREQRSEEIQRRFQPDGTITFVNDAACRFYQKKQSEMVGYNLASFLTSSEKEDIIAAIFSISPEKPVVVTRPNYIRTDGNVRCIEYENRGVFAPDGNILEYCSVGYEVDLGQGAVGEVAVPHKKQDIQVHRYLAKNNVGVFSDNMLEAVEDAVKYNQDRSLPVLIEGETGVGKEIIAKIIHFGPHDSLLPFVDINCTAISPNLFESELFGYEAGAFTGAAHKGQKGKLDCARGGSLFLDEVAEIPVDFQAKLLRVLEEKSFYRVGGLHKIATDIRVIAATNIGFTEHVKTGGFRKDLYYRLKVGHIRVPALRERKDEILPLARMFLKKFSEKRGKNFRDLSDSTAELFLNHSWPGNIRELKNLLDWASFMFDDTLLRAEHIAHRLEDISRCDDSDSKVVVGYKLASEVTPFDIQKALNRTKGNKTQAAKKLGISIRTLYNRLGDKK